MSKWNEYDTYSFGTRATRELTTGASHSWEEVAIAKRHFYQPKGYCASTQCTKGTYKTQVLITEDARYDFCPKCGDALIWKKS